MTLSCSQCGAPTDRIVDSKTLCVFCEDGVANPAAVKTISPHHSPSFHSLSEDKSMKEQKQCPGFEKACATMIGLSKELCTRCYARRHYRQSHLAKKNAIADHAPRKLKASPRRPKLEKINGHNSQISLTEPVVDRLIASFSFEQRVAMLRNFLEA